MTILSMHQTTLNSKWSRKIGKECKIHQHRMCRQNVNLCNHQSTPHNYLFGFFLDLEAKKLDFMIHLWYRFPWNWTSSKVVIFMAPHKVRERILEKKRKCRCSCIDVNVSPFSLYLSWVSMMQYGMYASFQKVGYVGLPSYYTMNTWFTTNCPSLLDPVTLKTKWRKEATSIIRPYKSHNPIMSLKML